MDTRAKLPFLSGVAGFVRRAPLVALAVVCATACASNTEATEGARARDVLAAVATENDVAGLTTALFAGAGRQVVISSHGEGGAGSSGGLRPMAFGDGAKLAFLPRGCLKTEANEATRVIVYTFANCTYLRSIRVQGDLTLSYQAAGTGFDVRLSSASLRIGAATTRLQGTANVRSEDAGLTLSLDWTLSGEGKRGTFTRKASRIVRWSLGSACFDASGTSEGTLGERLVSVTLGPFRRCRSQCPEADSVMAIRDEEQDYRLLFDGSDTATLVGENGSRSLTLACEP